MTVTVTAAPGLSWSLTGVKANVFPHGALLHALLQPPYTPLFHHSDPVGRRISPAGHLLPLLCLHMWGALRCLSGWGHFIPLSEPLGHVLKPSQVGPSFLSSGPRGTCMHPLSIQLNVWSLCKAAASDHSASEQTAVFSPLRYFRPVSDTSPRCSASHEQSFSILALLKFLA